MKKKPWIRVLAFGGIFALALRACALSGGPLSGQVIDQSTGKPVADAIVVAHWNGYWTKIFGESSSACYHVETARTDAQGKYHIPAWSNPWSIDDLRFSSAGFSVNVYKPRYARVFGVGRSPDLIYVAPFVGNNKAYFDEVLLAPGWACVGAAGESGKNEYRLFRAMAEEARALAETPEQMGRAQRLRTLAEESLVNFEKPTAYGAGGKVINVNPKDSFKLEEVPQ